MAKAAVILGLCLSLVMITSGQARRTVTNATLEKYQQKRLAAERDYRENYERMGFPSPEELERQREVDMAARLELAEKLRQARLEEERLELERTELALDAARLDAERESRSTDGYGYGYPGYLGGVYGGYGYPGGYYGGYDRFGRGRDFYPYGSNIGTYGFGGYRVSPFGVYPVRSFPRPFLVRPRAHPRGGAVIRGRRR